VGNMLKSSISLFGMRVSTMHPRENPTIMVLVVGGMSAAEARTVRQIVEERSTSVELLVGSTRLFGPEDCISAMFQKDPLHMGNRD
jgi:hypothetical protein